MAPGKNSRSKRSSINYTSTFTTIIFLSFCVFGVWLLTSSPIVPPQASKAKTNGKNEVTSATSESEKASHEIPVLSEETVKNAAQDGYSVPSIGTETENNEKGKTPASDEYQGVLEQNRHNQTIEEKTQENEGIKKTEVWEGRNDGKNQEEDNKGREGKQHNEDENLRSTTGDSKASDEKLDESEDQTGENISEVLEREKIQENTPEEESREISDNTQQPEKQESEEQEQTLEHSEEVKEEIRRQSDQQQVETEPQNNLENQNDVNHLQSSQQHREEQALSYTEEKNEQNPSQVESIKEQQESQAKISETNVIKSIYDKSHVENISKIDNGQWSTQEDQSENENERRKELDFENKISSISDHTWVLCNVTAGADYIPCLDNDRAVKMLPSTKHYEHRERHCPEESPTCLVSVPKGYKKSVPWPGSRDKIWYHNVPHVKLAEVKGHQNWVKVSGEFLTFPGGGTQFIHGALHYIDFIEQAVPAIKWGKHTRLVLDVGCGVASFGGYLFDRDVLTMSFAPKDEHEAQVQFALERGIPAISAVMGSQRLPFPSRVYDLIHCARCRVPWHAEDGALLLELNRVLRPGGYFVWSATPVYQKLKEDVEIWRAMTRLTMSMCWDLVTIKKDKLNSIAAAIYRKPVSNACYDNRKHKNPPICKEEDDSNAAWYVPLESCVHRVPVDSTKQGSKWPGQWPQRLDQPPYWLNNSQIGIYGKPTPVDFESDYQHWRRVVKNSYLSELGITWSDVRNIMDMRAVYGGFAAALRDIKVWVMNVVNIDSPDTLPIIFERGLFGIYHDWCESFSTYPRTYDLLHADHLFSKLKKRCKILPVVVEVDRILRPGGKFIVNDESSMVEEIKNLLQTLHWDISLTVSKGQEGLLCAQKTDWRPTKYEVAIS